MLLHSTIYIDLNQGRHLVDMVFETVCLKKTPRNEKLRISVNVMNHHEYVLGSSWKSSSSLSTFELNFEKACRLMIEYGNFAMEAAAASHVCSCQENCEEHQENYVFFIKLQNSCHLTAFCCKKNQFSNVQILPTFRTFGLLSAWQIHSDRAIIRHSIHAPARASLRSCKQPAVFSVVSCI